MVKLPVTGGTFKKGFLDGQGEVELTASPAILAAVQGDQPFPVDAKTLAFTAVSASPPSLSFGGDGPVRCTAGFSGSAAAGVEILRPGDTSAFLGQYVPDYRVAADRLTLRLFLEGTGSLSAAGTVPAIAGLTFGVAAGGKVSYSRVVALPAATTGRAALLDLVSDVRLPRKRGRPADLPQQGELVMLEYGGMLDLSAGMTWGYALTATESLDVGGLEASIDYALRLKAAATFGYKLAGEFLMIARAGERPGWVRLSVHKKGTAAASFAAAFAATGRFKADFAAETVDEVLIAFFGADARGAIQAFDRLRALTDLDALEKQAGKLLFAALQRLSHDWIGKALDHTSLGELTQSLGQVVDAYKQIDQRILDVYEDFLRRARLDELRAALQRIVALSGKDAIAGITDQRVLAVLSRLGGNALFALVEKHDAFAEIQGLAARALAFLDGGDKVRQLIDRLQADFKLDQVFGQLGRIASPEALLATTDRVLQSFVERIVGRTFAEIRASDAGKAFRELQATLARIDTFRTEMVASIEKALDRSLAMEVNYAYTRASSDKALIDMEFDVRDPEGVRLFELAADGQLAQVMDAAQLAIVRVREAVLTHQIARASQVRINAVGWTTGRLVELVSDTAITLEDHAGGLVQLFTAVEAVKQRRESGRAAKEVAQTVFMVTLAGEVDRSAASDAGRAKLEYLIKTLNAMSAGYEELFIDDRTKLPEMYEYLALARWLELIPPAASDPAVLPLTPTPGSVPSIDAFIRTLEREFPGGLGKVTARYVVRYDDVALREAFMAASGKDIESRVSQSCRRIIAGHLISPLKPAVLAAQGAAFIAGELRAAFESDGPNAVSGRSWTVTLPAQLGKSLGGRQVRLEANRESATVATAFILERDLCRAMKRLDGLVDEARDQRRRVPVKELSKATHDVLEACAGLDGFFGINVLFGVMDDLIQRGRQGRRQSSLVLDIEPPQGDKVTKYLMAGQAA